MKIFCFNGEKVVVLPHLTDVKVREGWLISVIWGREGLPVKRASCRVPCHRLCLGELQNTDCSSRTGHLC